MYVLCKLKMLNNRCFLDFKRASAIDSNTQPNAWQMQPWIPGYEHKEKFTETQQNV